jgi:uncharacterized surface protein with fasciclin (FAS1) repeats
MNIRNTAVAVLSVAALMGSAVAQAPTGDIVDTAVASGKFPTLVKLVQTAGLVETLKGKGPFTVFAPTEAAFAKLPKATVNALLKDKKALQAVLTYHVVPGAVMASDVVGLNGKKVKTVQGGEVKISVKNGKVKLNKSNVIQTDIKTTNGVIHVIDTVLMPPAAKKKH